MLPSPVTAKTGPVVRIADNYGKPTIDIDGDRKPDISHGELVERYIRSQVPDVAFDRFELRENNLDSESDETAFFTDRLDFALDTLDKINNNRYDAVCMMQGAEFPIHGLYTDKDGRSILTAENLDSQRQMIRTDLAQGSWEQGHILARTLDAFEEIAKSAPFYIGAGNSGPDSFNPYLLARGVIGVGATDAKGEITHYSSRNSLVSRYEQGTFATRKTEQGFDINNDGIAEVLNTEVSGGSPMSMRFIGKTVAEAVMSDEDFERELRLPGEFMGPADKLMSFKQLAQAGKIPPGYADKPLYGYAPFIFNIKLVFRADTEGRLVYDPDGSGLPGAVHELHGTSIAGPVAVGKDIAAGRKLDKTA